MGKISGLPDAERLAIIGYLAQEGVIREITAEVPIRRSAEFQDKYGVKPYIIRSDKKYSDQLRVYLTDPEDAPPLLRDALDKKYQRLNDSEFVRELVDDYGFVFFGRQNSRAILEYAKKLAPEAHKDFLSGYQANDDFVSSLRNAVNRKSLVMPDIVAVPDEAPTPTKGRKKKGTVLDSNASLSDEQLLSLGWSGEEYLYKVLMTGSAAAFAPFAIDADAVTDVVWFNQGCLTDENWTDGSVGKGCDILVKTAATEYLIEVKSSKRRSPIFGMTSFEMQTMMDKMDKYYLAKIDYLENLLHGQAPTLKVFQNPYDKFFRPHKMQKAIFFCE